jgi:hypothetical protein
MSHVKSESELCFIKGVKGFQAFGFIEGVQQAVLQG